MMFFLLIHYYYYHHLIGTFITIDISIQRLESSGIVNIQGTVEKIRQQRAFSIQTHQQYFFCCTTLVEYALCNGMLEGLDLGNFDETIDPSDDDE